MAKGIVIAGMAGVGKTVLAQKYANIMDLDHLLYKYTYPKEILENKVFEQLRGFLQGRTLNPKWPENYISKIFEALEQYDIVLVPASREIIEYFEKINFDYFLCYPTVKSKTIYLERYKNRNTNQEWIGKMNQNFQNDVKYFESKKARKLVLSGNETLEDKLKELEMIK